MARKPPIYAAIVPSLPDLPVDADRQTRLDTVKVSLHDKTPSQLAKIYSELRADLKRVQEEESTINLAIEAVTQMLTDSQSRGEEGWGSYGTTPSTLPLPNGDRVRIDIEPYATIEDRDAAREWAVKEGLGRLLSLPWTTLNAITKKRLLAGEPEPPGIKTFKKRTVVFTPMKTAVKEDQVPIWDPDNTPDVDI